jgi:pyruvate kinase
MSVSLAADGRSHHAPNGKRKFKWYPHVASHHDRWDEAPIASLIEELTAIRAEMVRIEHHFRHELNVLQPSYCESARNLLHYIALRRRDVRNLQQQLATMGLSSLGRSEAHVMANIDNVLALLHRLEGRSYTPPPSEHAPVNLVQGRRLLETHTNALLGPPPSHRNVRIMVTVPTEAANDYGLVRDLVEAGMDCMRINCAHDSRDDWERMVANLRRAEKETGRKCRILMDIAGPKLRTGPMEPGPSVVKFRPKRDSIGHVITPVRVGLFPEDDRQALSTHTEKILPVDREWLAKLRVGDQVEFSDARGADRTLTVIEKCGEGFWTESRNTAYVIPGIELHLRRNDRAIGYADTIVGQLPHLEQRLTLKRGDILILTSSPVAGANATYDAEGNLLAGAHISCTLAEVFSSARAGERVWFDDGKIGGCIKSASRENLEIEITQAAEAGSKLGTDKGINLPDTAIDLPALTAKDLDDLKFVVAHADAVGMSFVRRGEDVLRLHQEMERLGGGDLGVILKIETQQAFQKLPDLMLAVMHHKSSGIMIARGDLAVECGYERLAEVQEELLWFCEAAHMPVIWATQVLESQAKTGYPSRAEVTDAAMGERAECVMLNKGPHVVEAVRTLDDILRRMQAHQVKKTSMMRQLHVYPKLADAVEEREIRK